MNKLLISGATLFMFNPVEKKWRQRGNGDVTFSVNFKDLMISLGKLSFLVKGGIRSKGTRSVVMRVKEDYALDKKARILACRFERARDVETLFVLLSGKRSCGRKWSAKQALRTPPPWFLAMQKCNQEKIKALVSKGNPQYIRDGIVQRELIALYNMTPAQVNEVIELYNPGALQNPSKDTSGQGRNRVKIPSFDQSVITLPSVSLLTQPSPGWRQRHYIQPHQSFKTKLEKSSQAFESLVSLERLKTTHVGVVDGILRSLSPKGSCIKSLSEQNISNLVSTDDAVHLVRALPIKSSSVQDPLRDAARGAHAGAVKYQDNSNIKVRNLLKTVNVGCLTPNGTPCIKVEKTPPNISNEKLKYAKEKQSTPITVGASKNKLYSTNISLLDIVVSTNCSPGSHFKPSHLTAKNLMLYNKLVPSLKGDYKQLVSRWLDRSLPVE